MKLTDVRPTPDIVVSPNTTTKSYRVDDRNAAQIARVLINAYKKPLRAVAREYLANAIDAHTQAGVSDKVEVDMPVSGGGLYRVRDFGTGMTVDDAEQYFFSFGSSDPAKHASNAIIGGFGNGGKCAFTVCDGFTMTSVCAGKRNTWLIVMGSDGRPSYSRVEDDVDTDERSGTLIQIPIARDDVNSFVAEFEDVSTWIRDRIVVRGDVLLPAHEIASELKVVVAGVDCTIAMLWSQQRSDYLVIGGFGYPVDSDYKLISSCGAERNSICAISNRIVIKIPVGVVELAPTRETLINSKPTKAFLSALDTVLRGLDSLSLVTDAEDKTAAMTIKEYYGLDWDNRRLLKYQGYAGKFTESSDTHGMAVTGGGRRATIERSSRRGSTARFSIATNNSVRVVEAGALFANMVVVIGHHIKPGRNVSLTGVAERVLAYAQTHEIEGWTGAVSATSGAYRGDNLNLLWLNTSAGNEWAVSGEFTVIDIKDLDVVVPNFCRRRDPQKPEKKKSIPKRILQTCPNTRPSYGYSRDKGAYGLVNCVTVAEVKAAAGTYVVFDRFAQTCERNASEHLVAILMHMMTVHNMTTAEPVYADAKQEGWWRKFGMKCGYEVLGEWLKSRLATAERRRAVAAAFVLKFNTSSGIDTKSIRLINALASRREFNGLEITKPARAVAAAVKCVTRDDVDTASVLSRVLELGLDDLNPVWYPESLVGITTAAMKEIRAMRVLSKDIQTPWEDTLWPTWPALTDNQISCKAIYTGGSVTKSWDSEKTDFEYQLEFTMCSEVAKILARQIRECRVKNDKKG